MARLCRIVHDLVVAGTSFFLAYVTVIGWTAASTNSIVWEKTLIFIPVAFAVFLVFSVHRGSWRYVSIPEFLTIIKVSLVAVVVYTFGSFLLSRGINVPRSVPVLAGMYMIAGLAGSRLAYRLFLEGSILPSFDPEGCRSWRCATSLAAGHDRQRRKLHSPDTPRLAGRLEIVGVLDELPRRHARSVQGVKVYGALPDLETHRQQAGAKGHQGYRACRDRDVAGPAAPRPHRRKGDQPRPQGIEDSRSHRNRAIDQPFIAGAEADRTRRPARPAGSEADVQGSPA